jgi:hypothetical protein
VPQQLLVVMVPKVVLALLLEQVHPTIQLILVMVVMVVNQLLLQEMVKTVMLFFLGQVLHMQV